MLITLPSAILDFNPNCICEPTLAPITAGINEIEPSLNLTFANGTSRPRS